MPNEKDGFTAYYKKFKDKIYTYFWYRVNFNQKTAEDLTSEVFLKAFKNFDNFDSSRSFQSWIFAISRNHLINYYKICQREVSLSQAENIIKLPGVESENKLELERIIKIIEAMEDSARDVLLLKFVDGLSNNEIARVLYKDEGAVRTQISRSLNKLRQILKT